MIATPSCANLVAYLREIGSEEATAPAPPLDSGTGLAGPLLQQHHALPGTAVLKRVEAVNFNWGSASPGTGVNRQVLGALDRHRGSRHRPATSSSRPSPTTACGCGSTASQVINNWSNHAATTNTSGTVALIGGTRYTIKMEFFDNSGQAVAQLRWKTPGASSYVAIPASRLYAP